MKTLFLIRHAKSDWGDISLRDFDRPLNKRGLRDAPFMATGFATQFPQVEKIISSPANRACTTAQFFVETLGIKKENFTLDERIYEAPVSNLLEVIGEIDSGFSTVVMIGHNPGFSELVNYLSDQFVEMPTCAIAHLELQINDWSHVSAGIARLVNLDYPKGKRI